ncbi:MAG TPA: hypothetical protein PLW93_05470, partial [Candidatus Absconditabacterales bacterium]|nr:hypothetical protein [Candidatus Absconditabacterales bacterium]
MTYIDQYKKDCITKLIQECIHEQYVTGPLDAFVRSVTNKIEASLRIFLENDMYADGYIIAHIQGPLFEIRISLPRTKQLMRIFFACERNALILLTGGLIKPKRYTQKKQLQAIEKIYTQTIQDAFR